MGKVMRLAVLLLVACASFGQYDCDADAIARWNRFVGTAKRYTDLREQGIRSAKERARMEQQFHDVMACDCF